MILIAIDLISDKIIYLIKNNEGKLFDLNGMPFNIISNNKIKDINGRLYILNKIITPVSGNQNWNEVDVLWDDADEWNQSTNTKIYGVQWDINDATTTLTRIGNMPFHNASTGLPVQNNMKRCLLLDNGTVNYYLNPNNSLQKADGSPAILDGTDGQVMVEIPEHYRKFEFDGDIQRVLMSENPFEGAHLVQLQYISAFEASLQRSTSKLSSVINTTTDYRGGNNTDWDAEARSLLGIPVTSLSRINFTAFASNRGSKWFQMLYQTYKDVIWLYMIEYAQRNSQTSYNSSLTVEGYQQGGLGDGVTNINGTAWSNFNSFNPFITCGSGVMNNFTTSTPITHPTLGATQIPVYRGIEHPFGHIWKWGEGINVRSLVSSIEMYTSNEYTFSSTDYTGYTLQGNLDISNNYIKTLLTGSISNQIEIMPSIVGLGASATTFWSDQYFQSRPSSGESLRAVFFGGGAANGASAGFLLSSVISVPSSAGTAIGGRLCFVPNA